MPFLSILVLALLIGALIDIIVRDQSQVKHLPKMFWILIVVLLPLIGSILWFTLGREYGEGGVALPRMPRREARGTRAPSAPQRTAPPVDSRTTEQQIADLDREIEEWRLREEIAKRKSEENGPSTSSGTGPSTGSGAGAGSGAGPSTGSGAGSGTGSGSGSE